MNLAELLDILERENRFLVVVTPLGASPEYHRVFDTLVEALGWGIRVAPDPHSLSRATISIHDLEQKQTSEYHY